MTLKKAGAQFLVSLILAWFSVALGSEVALPCQWEPINKAFLALLTTLYFAILFRNEVEEDKV